MDLTLLELWQAVQAGGTGFVLFLGVVLFFRGHLVNGGVARQARQDSEAALRASHDDQMALMRQRFDEMQAVWQDRRAEVAQERDYYRSFALQFARQAEQGIAVAEVLKDTVGGNLHGRLSGS